MKNAAGVAKAEADTRAELWVSAIYATALTTTPNPAEILAARQNAGMTQTEASDAIGHSRASWAKWEAGDHDMPSTAFNSFLLATSQIH